MHARRRDRRSHGLEGEAVPSRFATVTRAAHRRFALQTANRHKVVRSGFGLHVQKQIRYVCRHRSVAPRTRIAAPRSPTDYNFPKLRACARPYMFDNFFTLFEIHGAVAQLVEHHVRNVGVRSSNLLRSTMFKRPPVTAAFFFFSLVDIFDNRRPMTSVSNAGQTLSAERRECNCPLKMLRLF